MAPKKSTASKGAAPTNGGDAAPASESLKVGDIVLAKLKGYPDWPARIVDHDSAGPAVMKVKGNRSILVRFFPDADYAWNSTKECKLLSPKLIDAYLSDTGKKNGKLRIAYETAKDPKEWEEKQEKAAADRAANPDNDEEEEEEDDEEEDVDMLAEDGEEAPTKKRKRAADKKAPGAKKDKKEATTKGAKKAAAADKEKKAPASKAKKETKSKDAPAAKKRKTDDAEKKPESKAAGKGKAAAKKDAAPSSAAPADDSSDGAKTVKGWRASLQKGFLTKGVPSADKMPEYDTIFKNMEAFEMQAEWLAVSKLGKVLKKMSALDNIEREEEFKIRERCNTLMEKWKEMLNKEGGDEAGSGAVGAAGGTEEVAGTGASEEAGDLTMMDASAPAEAEKKDGESSKTNGTATEEKKEGVNAEGQTNSEEAPMETDKKEETEAAPAA